MKKIIANFLIFIGSVFGVDLLFVNWEGLSTELPFYSKPIDIPTYSLPEMVFTLDSTYYQLERDSIK